MTNATTQRTVELSAVVTRVLGELRGWPSPEALVRAQGEGASPTGATIRRIANGTDLCDTPGELWKLARLSVWLGLPGLTLNLVRVGDSDAIARLDFKGDEDARRFILDAMTPPPRALRNVKTVRP